MNDLFARYLDSWNHHTVDELLAFFTDDATYVDVALNQSHTGSAGIREFIASLESQFSSDYRFDPGLTLVGDNGYAVEWVMKGTHDGSRPALAATNKPYAIRGVSVGELRDGKILRNTDYWSLASFSCRSA